MYTQCLQPSDNKGILEILKISLDLLRRTGSVFYQLVLVAFIIVPSVGYEVNQILFQQLQFETFIDVCKTASLSEALL